MNIEIHKKQPIFNNYVIATGSLNREKTLRMTENTGFTGSVVANWLQKSVINLLSE